jgi:hypothetical protein
MNTVIKIVLFLSLGIAIKTLLVFNPFVTDSGTSSNSPVSPPVTVSVPFSEKLPNRPTVLAIGEDSIQTSAKAKIFQITDRDLEPDEIQSLSDHSLEQLYDVIWQAVETGSDDYADFQMFALSTPDERQHESPGEMLAELIRTAPTTDMQVDALRLLAEASQELSVSPLSLERVDSDAEFSQLTMKFFDEYTVGGFLDAVTEVVENGNQRERLAALSTLEEMHQFAPIWEVAYTVVDDPDPQIRMRALELLTYGDRQAATEHLLTALSDPDPDISELAEKLLIGLAEAPT